MPIPGGEHPEADAKRHSRALQDAQAPLEALADRYDVLTSKGDPAAAAFLAPEPLVYDEAGPVPQPPPAPSPSYRAHGQAQRRCCGLIAAVTLITPACSTSRRRQSSRRARAPRGGVGALWHEGVPRSWWWGGHRTTSRASAPAPSCAGTRRTALCPSAARWATTPGARSVALYAPGWSSRAGAGPKHRCCGSPPSSSSARSCGFPCDRRDRRRGGPARGRCPASPCPYRE